MFTNKDWFELFGCVSQERVIALLSAVFMINYCRTHLGRVARGTSRILLQYSHIISALVGDSWCLSSKIRYLQCIRSLFGQVRLVALILVIEERGIITELSKVLHRWSVNSGTLGLAFGCLFLFFLYLSFFLELQELLVHILIKEKRMCKLIFELSCRCIALDFSLESRHF